MTGSGRHLPQFLLTAVILILLNGCAEPVSFKKIPAGSSVLAFGDSVTFGTGARPGEDYPSQLAAMTGWSIVNAGIPGDLARDARYRLGGALAEHQPELVLLWLGGNDFLRKRPPSDVRHDLRKMINEIRDSGAQVVLIAVPRLSLLRATVGALEDSSIYAQLAEEENIPLISGAFSAVLSESDLRADRVHPNAEGYRVLTEQFLAQLREMGIAP